MPLSLICVIRFKSYEPKHVFPVGLYLMCEVKIDLASCHEIEKSEIYIL